MTMFTGRMKSLGDQAQDLARKEWPARNEALLMFLIVMAVGVLAGVLSMVGVQ